MKVALAQIDSTSGDLEGNVQKCLDAITRGKESGADLVILPEMAVPGAQPRDIMNDSSFVEAALAANADLAERAACGPAAVVGTIIRSDAPIPDHPSLLNAAVLLQGGNQTLVAAKRGLQSRDVFFDHRWFVPGRLTPPVEVAGKRILFAVGDDIYDTSTAPAGDFEILVGISASPFVRGGPQERERRAANLQKPLFLVNACGANDELIYDGNSFAKGDGASFIARLAAFKEDFLIADSGSVHALPPACGDPDKELYEALVAGILGFATKNKIERVFVGLSGGIDSAVVVALAADALPPGGVTAVAVPSRHTDPRSTETARELAATLGIGFEVVGLDHLHSAAEATLGKLLDAGNANENMQARLRAAVLMAFVNSRGGMLLNTSNKTELSLGYSTLYGDSAGTLCPLGDLTKPEVYSLARWIDANRHPIPKFIMERPPTAELSPGQVDPFDYDKVSPEMEFLVRSDRSDAAMRRSEHKRRQMGVILKVGPRSFGSGRLMPITRR